jgi:hypothetical protein
MKKSIENPMGAEKLREMRADGWIRTKSIDDALERMLAKVDALSGLEYIKSLQSLLKIWLKQMAKEIKKKPESLGRLRVCENCAFYKGIEGGGLGYCLDGKVAHNHSCPKFRRRVEKEDEA